MTTPAFKKLTKARTQVVLSQPFFGSLLLRQELSESRDVATMSTNGKTLRFNPDWVMEQPMEQLRFVCAHEAMHPALLHHIRRNGRDHDTWNEACDYAINPILVDAGMVPTPNALLSDEYRDMTADQIYSSLIVDKQDGDDSGAPNDDNDDDDGDDDGESGGMGGSSGNDDGDGEQAPDYGGTGSFEDGPAQSDDQAMSEANEWAVALGQAENMAKAAGNIPGGMDRLIQQTLHPTANWRELLRRYMDQFARDDYAWCPPNRRFIAQNVYLPSQQSDQLPPILFVIDASGSMPEQALSEAVSELNAILEDLAPERVDVISHDTEVTSHNSYAPGDAIDTNVPGGGGTQFAPVVDWINDQTDPYACVIWFTDLEAWDWNDCDDVEAPVLWLDWTGHNADQATFGDEVIDISEARE